MLIVIIIVVAAGAGAYVLLLAAPSNQAPTAAFTFTVEGLTVSFDASGSMDPDGRIIGYDWTFGDGITDTGRSVQHVYAAAGPYNVTLVVSDNGGATASKTERVTVEDRPVAKFAVARTLMAVQVDARASYALAGATIASYAWDWGDGNTTTGPTASHTYATRGKKTIGLTVTDSRGASGSAAHVTSVASSTIDVVMYDFFNVSYGEWWDLRGPVYGDKPIAVDRLVDAEFPYMSLYPWPGDTTMKEDLFIYSMFRMNVTARNLSAMTIAAPVMLPVFGNPAIMGDRVRIQWYMQYLDTARQQALGAAGFPVGDPYMDGFASEWDYTLTMDYNSSRRFFNVSGNPTMWWANETKPGNVSRGDLETAWVAWLENLGKRTYDVFSAYEAIYQVIQFDVNATVSVNPDGSNTTTVKVFLVSWGQEVLTARWFYWGSGSYPNGTPVAANGWWPEELGWFEDFTFDGTLYPDHVDFSFDSAIAYQFIELALPGPDGQYNTADDEPVWSWYPQLMDYIYGGVRNPRSEMDQYLDPVTHLPRTAISAHPGNKFYGQQYTVDQMYWKWDLRDGETMTMVFPKVPVIFHDPVQSRWNPSGIPDLVNITAPLTLRRMLPAGVGTWDEASKTFSMAGPFAMGGTPPLFEGLPRIDVGPKR
ncbi:MAG: hypothetical protein A3K65_09010 [Euryarchaeota archaeon RBG_16_68_12]|nr:MAG: hypothetical protein A3K65_09010 [Euryarchaeota archaeon RBG_16_68_12]